MYENKEQEIIDIILEMIKLGYPDEKIVKDFEVKLLKLHNLKLSQFFSVNIKGADVKAHGQVIIDSEDLDYNYKFASDVKGADVRAHGKVIINSGSIEYNEKFKLIEGSDIDAHVTAINNTKIQKCKESLNECLDSMIKEKVKVKK